LPDLEEPLVNLATGAPLWILTSKVPLRDSTGKVVGLVGIGRNITERKRADEEIHRLNSELEQRVQERTQELAAANKELEAFSYSVSHDLRSPLRSIDGFSAALERKYSGQLGDEGEHYIERIRAATHNMGQLITDLLNLSRVTRREMARQQVNLSALAHTVIAELQSRDPARKVEWIIADGVWGEGDESLLQIVLTNLLDNAWKFSGTRPQARIEFGMTNDTGETVYFVRDNGVGFDMAYAENLFGAFQRLHSVREFPGTGIGLATVQRIVHRHGGRVWADAALERGATFFFTLGEGQ
jgi:light-regulated signal transduction histidine kinase (bacteriophytochrome)